LVCSNSLRSNQLHNAAGLLKEELRRCGSLLISTADKHAVPAGSSLAVSRDDFADSVTKKIMSTKGITVVDQEVKNLNAMLRDYDAVVLATGPHTFGDLSNELRTIIGEEYLYFYDAIAPLVELGGIDMDMCFRASRGGEGKEGDYINAPFSKDEYYNFVDELKNGIKTPIHSGDEGVFFRGCMPIEVMAEDSADTLLYGPMRSDGIIDPRTGKRPYAVIQFRQDRAAGDIYNIVGFQTRLTYPEQMRIFKKIPGLKNAEFVRLGSMHRNTYVNAPRVMNPDMSLKKENRIFLAGQISGVEGYIESIAQSFFVAGTLLTRFLVSKSSLPDFPDYTAMGALRNYLINAEPAGFQPMKINLGLLPPLSSDDKKEFVKAKSKFENKLGFSKRSLAFFDKYISKIN
ncbi:MAG: methylenetetrahydrofolate--tRNA-(uracil(54)-C(5))-methyltransferase (FADH(2)-oxidizing) TrmFO, partial [Proteobacteria bacterium]|nr:methylenetetrahydrofolate--tRNA-(uracil(54)-C(5))-methyltransferase (FADH(2)-oxidizing) TrmFO [Pseudomonadota bacterium]